MPGDAGERSKETFAIGNVAGGQGFQAGGASTIRHTSTRAGLPNSYSTYVTRLEAALPAGGRRVSDAGEHYRMNEA